MDKQDLPCPIPRATRPPRSFCGILSKFKKDNWLDLVALAKQKPLLVESLAPVTTTIIKGEAPVGITYIKYVKQYKGPVHYVLMDKYLTDPNYMSRRRQGGSIQTRPSSTSTSSCSAGGPKTVAEDGEFVLCSGSVAADQGRGKSQPEYHFHGQSVRGGIQEADERHVPRDLFQVIAGICSVAMRERAGPAEAAGPRRSIYRLSQRHALTDSAIRGGC